MVSLSARTTTQCALLPLAVAMLCASGAQAKDLPGGFIQPGQATAAPRGFVEMCESGAEPSFCSPTRPLVASAALVTAGLSERASDRTSRDRDPLPGMTLPALASSVTRPVDPGLTGCTPPIDPRLGLGGRLRIRLTGFDDMTDGDADACPTAAPLPAIAPTPWQRFAPPALVRAVAWQAPHTTEVSPFAAPPAAQMTDATQWARPGPCAPSAITSMVMAVSTQLCSFALPEPPAPLPKAPDTPKAEPLPTALPESELKAMLKQVNHHVNGRVRQRTDAEIYGVGELWRRSGDGKNAVGDCEDLAIEKRAELIAAGFPPDRLAFAVVYSRDAGLHTVLVARTDVEDVVLDGRSPYVTNWSKTPYSWISVQSMNDPMLWYAPSHAQAA